MKNTTIDVRPVSAAVGAEILNVDLADPLQDRTYREIRNALNEHGVIFFRDQKLTPAQHLAFTELFGETEHDDSSSMAAVDGFPMIGEVRKEPEATRNIGGNWHSDHSFDPLPPLGAVLLARELPDYGGDTLFASMYAAYDALSDGLKKTLNGLNAVHAKTRAFVALPTDRQVSAEEKAKIEQKFAAREAVHPVTPRHPESGRRVLFVNPTYTVRFEGWTEKESRPLLEYLFQHAQRPEFTYRFQWREGSIAFWDNRSVWHYALNDYHGSRRLMHRICVKGTGFGLSEAG
ncbi:MAG TPA: TauD/TfdA family dioxygenase [Xanthobacteraceae bacterium]|jgi:alpha-ketoglutarate-dependent taurine dioxygenase|nr:TauD/TfdA family dioxygenase [Xanthobacteraceae bacterium]